MTIDDVPTARLEHGQFVLDIDIDRDSAEPLYQQISGPLQAAIEAGAVPVGGFIEDEVSMAKRLEVSRPTARRALQDLVIRGLVSRRRGVGTRVNSNRVRRPMAVTSLDDDLRKAGYETHTDVLSYQTRFADQGIAARLECEEGVEVVEIERLRWSNGEPLAILANVLPAEFAPTLTELTTVGLYQALRDRGVQLASGQQHVSARNARERESVLLRLHPGAALLTMERWMHSPSGRVIEHGDHVYNPKLYSLSFSSVAE